MLKKIAEQKGKKKRREQSPFLFLEFIMSIVRKACDLFVGQVKRDVPSSMKTC